MSEMVRKQIYIRPDQEERLKREANLTGLSEAELIRRGIDQLARTLETDEFRHQAWQEIEAFMRQRMSLEVPETGRGWTREELYEDRLARRSH